MLQPEFRRLFIALQVILFGTFKHGHIQVVGIQVQHIHQVFPGIVDGSLFEVVAEAPVAQHFKHGVVVGVVTHLFQVVVLSAYAQAFLRVGPASWLRVASAEYHVLPLVHSGVGEHQRGVVFDYHGCRWHDLVSFVCKERLERFAYFVGCHHCFILFLKFFYPFLLLGSKITEKICNKRMKCSYFK